MGENTEVVPFDPQSNPVISAAMEMLRGSKAVPDEFMTRMDRFMEMEVTGEGVSIKPSSVKMANQQVLEHSLRQYDVKVVKGTERYYARQMDPMTNTPIDSIYRPMDREELMTIVTRNYEKTTHMVDGQAIDKIMNSVDKKIRMSNTIDKVDNTIIQLLPDLFWNTDNGDVYDHVPENFDCFRRLFDTPKGSKHIVKYNPGDFDDLRSSLIASMKIAHKEMNDKGDLEEDPDFEFLQTVACGDHERYMDIIRMFATFFMKRKPLGTYILEGNGRNGKSGLIGLIHTIMGTNNTSKLQLGELGDWHKNHCLINTLVNAPDEEKQGTLEDTDLFRVIADHGDIELPVMRGQRPIEVSCNFQCVSASNHLPDWKGPDAEACIRRARIIPFEADLSGNDNKSESFEQITYTPERVIHFLGTALGVAKYYMTHDFPESNGDKAMKEVLKQNMVSYRIYYTEFVKYFGTYHRLRDDVFEDYVIWCKDHGYDINKFEDFREAFNLSRGKKTCLKGEYPISVVYRVSDAEWCMHAHWSHPELEMYGDLKRMHEAGVSALSLLEELNNRKIEAWEQLGLKDGDNE